MRLILEQSSKVDTAAARSMAMEMRRRLKGRKFPDIADLVREDRER